MYEGVDVQVVAEGRVHASHVIEVASEIEVALPLFQSVVRYGQLVDPCGGGEGVALCNDVIPY